MSDKADWCDVNIRHLIDIMKGEIQDGNRPLGQLTRSGWKNLVAKYHENTNLKQTKKQLRNKLDNLKKEFTWFMEFKNSATGLGWNETKQTVDCSDEWWNEHLARCNNPEKGIKCNHVKFRKQGPKYLDDLHILFDKVHVTGATASCPRDISSADSSEEDVAEIQKTPESDDVKLAALKKAKPGKRKRKDSSSATEEKDEKSPFFRLYKNTCMRIESAADKISTSVSASSAPLTNQVPTIKEVMQMVKECGVEEKTALMHTTTFLIVKPEFREVFSSLETNKGRLDLLEREHAARRPWSLLMNLNMKDVTKKGQKGLQLLAELSQHAALLGEMGNQYTERYLHKGEYRVTKETGIQWVMRCLTTPRYFYKMFWMSPDVFSELHDLLILKYGLTSSNNVSSIESLAMFLWIVGGPQSFSQVENRFTRSIWIVHTKFYEVLHCLLKLAKNNIKPTDPTFSTAHERVKEDRFWPYFKGAIGAIDGTHVLVEVEPEEVVNHTCRHGNTTQNVLAICDFDMRFIYAVAGWPGSAHDTRILNHALANFPSFPVPPKGKYYLVDSGYPNRIGYLAPFKESTYHILEFWARSGRPP